MQKQSPNVEKFPRVKQTNSNVSVPPRDVFGNRGPAEDGLYGGRRLEGRWEETPKSAN